MPESSDSDFLPLLIRARDGDKDALGQLIDQYRPYLLRIAFDEADTNLQGRDGDSDYVQEACVQAIVAFHAFEGQTGHEMRAWLRSILLNQIKDARKHGKAQKRAIHAQVPLDNEDSRNENLAVCPTSPSEILVQQEEREMLEKALAVLSERDRLIFELRQKDGQAFAEIARQLNLSEDATQKRWARAVKAIQQKVSQLNDSSDA